LGAVAECQLESLLPDIFNFSVLKAASVMLLSVVDHEGVGLDFGGG